MANFKKIGLLSSSMLVGLPAAVQAQTVAAAPSVHPAPTGEALASPAQNDQVPDIVVTAERRSEDVLKVPLSVTVVSGDTLRTRGISDLTSVTKLAPSLQVAQDLTFSIRGVGTSTFSSTVESSVSEVVDDVVLGSNEFAANAFYDVERVEVLNGPQGLLFGKNASAGLVNITTVEPKIGVFSNDTDFEMDDRDRPVNNGHGIQVRDTLNIPISTNSALRLNAIYSGQDSITYPQVNNAVRNDLGDRNLGLRAKYLLEPNDHLSFYLIADYNKERGISGRYDVTFREFGPASVYPPLGLQAGPDNLIYTADASNYRDSETGGLQGKITYGLSNGMELTNITAWKRLRDAFQFDSDNTPVNFFDNNEDHKKFDQLTEELRLTLPRDNTLSGQFGLYYYHSVDNENGLRGGNNGLPDFVSSGFPFCINPTVLGAPPTACPYSNTSFLGQDYRFTLHQDSYAAYGQLQYALTDTLKLTAGGRVTHDKASINLLENTGSYFVTLGVPNNLTDQSTSATNFSFKVGSQWQATPDLMLYGYYGQGYKGPGFSNTSPSPGANLAVRPEISKGGEFGIKGRMLDRRVSFSLSAFYTKFSDLQVQSFVQSLRTFVLSNAAEATTKGVEFSFRARPTKRLTLSGSAAYTDANFDDYPGAQCYPTQTTNGCVANVNSSDPSFVGVFDAAGYPLPLSARFTATLGADYEAPITERLNGVIGADYYHRSPESTGLGSVFDIPTWDTIGAHVGIQTGNWTLSVFCKNCTNEIRPISIGSDGGDGNPTSGPPVLTLAQRWSYDSVRTFGLRGSVNF